MSSGISVCHVISGDLWAGAEVQVYNLCSALHSTSEIQLSAVLFNEGTLSERLRLLGIPVTVANEKTLNPVAISRRIASHCRHHAVDIVHTHGFKENVLGVLAKWIARVNASVRTVHGNPETPHRISSPVKWCTHKLDILCGRLGQEAIVAVSGQLAETLRQVYGPKVYKIHNFVDVDSIRATAGMSKEEHRRSFETRKSDEPVLGLVGRLVPVKRVDLFIETIQRLNESNFNCKGVIFGSGPLEESLRQQVQSCNIEDRISFRGFIDPVAPHLKELDALIMTSDHEGLPMTLLEALALEVPVVAHSVGGMPDVLQHGESGWLVSDHTPKGYMLAVTKLFESEARMLDKCKQGLEYTTREFGSDTNSRQYINLYSLYKTPQKLRDGTQRRA